ncbi:aminotransferase class I/II-fold pyridoxal phosphate-dependent enzyme [Agreia sp. PsM10]|uniref:pyridoxal phosphate-dependent aminotransferase n=1 Tax=Agreia sp. PsM10 TaxID=3030533 RepID=UPI00263A4505|nr:aminotransferase class I/II-fold pyridoxal phosphate-dependent enzyme [Agreia sp. PsM10]MDN4641045.1 aminotransferase class I/II-fold pyridoxal phosphate-dependent enzyme [Agreia sp. PsM10]
MQQTPATPRYEPSERVVRTHMPERSGALGSTVRELDRALQLNGGGNGLLDTTHFDTVRFPPPEWAAPVMLEAMADGALAYTPYRGHPAVLDALGHSLTTFLGVPVAPENIAITAGTQSGLFTTLSALVDEGDLVLLADPEYLFAERMLALLGARVVRIPIDYRAAQPTLDLDAVEALLLEKPVLFMFSHPSNPTGAVYAPETIDRLAALAVEGDFLVLADELYSRLVYGETELPHMVAAPGMRERCITMLGPSKTESLSGFRLGVVVGPAPVMELVEQTLALTSLRAPAYAQQLLTHWLVDDADFVAERVLDLEALQAMTVARLREVPGLTVLPHRGTAYLWVDVSALGASDYEVAAALRSDAGVIVSPGYQFGPSGTGMFRVCFARDEIEWEAALDRMVATLSAMGVRS